MTKKNDKRVKYQDTLIVVRLVSENPKKPGSASRARFDRYPEVGVPVSIGELLKDADGPTRADLIWDSERSFVAVGTEASLIEEGHLPAKE